MTIVLHRFPLSHFSEKARAALDFKGLEYRIVDHRPGPEQIAIYRLSGQRKLPVIEHDGTVVGFATYEHFRGEGKWPGYAATKELSIHVARSAWGAGVGRRLMDELVERARSSGVHVLVAGIDGDNAGSIRFHERLGFEVVGRMPEIGLKFGRRLDLVLMQRIVGPPGSDGNGR